MSTAISSRPVRSRKPVKSFYDDAKRELDSSQESSKGKTSIDENVKSTSQSPKRYATRGSLSPSRYALFYSVILKSLKHTICTNTCLRDDFF